MKIVEITILAKSTRKAKKLIWPLPSDGNGIFMTLSKARREDRHAETSKIGLIAEYLAPGW